MVRIVTDTASDITLRQAKQMGVEIAPLRVMFGDIPYDQLSDETFTQFYELLEHSRELPTTSQPTPEEYITLFSDAKAAGDSVVVIALSSALSGTYQSAMIAKDLADYECVFVLDSKQAVMGQRLLVEYAVQLRDEGKSAAEIYIILQEAAGRVVLFASLDTLKYLRKGGRIPKSAEVLGSVLGIKPLIRLHEGSIEMAGKARGHAGAMTTLVKLMDENSDFDEAAPVYFGYTRDDAACQTFRKLVSARYHLQNTRVCPVGATVGTHIGPGAVAVAYLVHKGE